MLLFIDRWDRLSISKVQVQYFSKPCNAFVGFHYTKLSICLPPSIVAMPLWALRFK